MVVNKKKLSINKKKISTQKRKNGNRKLGKSRKTMKGGAHGNKHPVDYRNKIRRNPGDPVPQRGKKALNQRIGRFPGETGVLGTPEKNTTKSKNSVPFIGPGFKVTTITNRFGEEQFVKNINPNRPSVAERIALMEAAQLKDEKVKNEKNLALLQRYNITGVRPSPSQYFSTTVGPENAKRFNLYEPFTRPTEPPNIYSSTTNPSGTPSKTAVYSYNLLKKKSQIPNLPTNYYSEPELTNSSQYAEVTANSEPVQNQTVDQNFMKEVETTRQLNSYLTKFQIQEAAELKKQKASNQEPVILPKVQPKITNKDKIAKIKEAIAKLPEAQQTFFSKLNLDNAKILKNGTKIEASPDYEKQLQFLKIYGTTIE